MGNNLKVHNLLRVAFYKCAIVAKFNARQADEPIRRRNNLCQDRNLQEYKIELIFMWSCWYSLSMIMNDRILIAIYPPVPTCEWFPSRKSKVSERPTPSPIGGTSTESKKVLRMVCHFQFGGFRLLIGSLRYESSTPTYKELSSSIFQSLPWIRRITQKYNVLR